MIKILPLFLTLCGISTNLFAAQIGEVIRENRSLESSQTEVLISIPASIESQNTFFLSGHQVGRLLSPVVKNGKKSSGGEGPARIGMQWSDSQTIRLFRERADELNDAQIQLNLQAAIFRDGVKVQSGVSIFDANSIEKEISIEAVNLESTFPILTVASEDWFSNQSEAFTFTATFPNETTLKLIRNDAPEGDREADAAETKVFWQVVEFLDGTFVRSGTANINYYSTEAEIDLSESPISNLSKTFLVFNYAAGSGTDGVEGLIATRGGIKHERALEFHRAKKGTKSTQAVDIAWYLIEFKDEASIVQRGSEHFNAGDYERTVTLNPIDPSRSIVMVSSSGGLGPKEGKTASDFMHNNLFCSEILSSTELRLSRTDDPEVEELEADVEWTAVEFSPISMGAPRGGEVYRVGNVAEVTWEHAASLERFGKLPDGSHSVSLFLSLNEGEDEFPYKIASKLPAKNDSYSWLVPEKINQKNLIGNKLRMKVVDTDLKERNSSVSRQNFAIKGNLKLVMPNGKEIWRAGDQDREIVWNYQGSIGTISIYYDLESGYHIDSFSSENAFAKKILAGNNGVGSFTLQSVPDITSKTVKVKVVQDSDPTVYDISRNDFSILPAIAIVSPGIERDKWTAQTEQVIKWRTKGTIQSFDLYYSTDLGKRWNLIERNQSKGFENEYSYRWQIPIESIGKIALIKVEKSGMKDVFGISSKIEEEALQIVPWIEIMKPKPDQMLDANRKTEVVWRLNGPVQFLQIESSIDAGKTWNKEAVVAADVDNYQWLIPNFITNQLMLRLIDTGNYEHQAVSITMQTQGTIEVLFPNGGETLKQADAPVIHWKKSQGMAGVDILYSTDGGLNYPEANLLAQNVTADSWTWKKLPFIFNSNVKIKIVSHQDSSISDESDQKFSIEAS